MWTSRRRSGPSRIPAAGMRRWPRRAACRPSLLLHDEFAVLDLQLADIVRKFHLIALLRQLLLQRRIHQRNRDAKITQFEFRRIEGCVSIFRPKMAGDRQPY